MILYIQENIKSEWYLFIKQICYLTKRHLLAFPVELALVSCMTFIRCCKVDGCSIVKQFWYCTCATRIVLQYGSGACSIVWIPSNKSFDMFICYIHQCFQTPVSVLQYACPNCFLKLDVNELIQVVLSNLLLYQREQLSPLRRFESHLSWS